MKNIKYQKIPSNPIYKLPKLNKIGKKQVRKLTKQMYQLIKSIDGFKKESFSKKEHLKIKQLFLQYPLVVINTFLLKDKNINKNIKI